MKSIAVVALASALCLAGFSAPAKTITSSQGNANEKSTAGVAGTAAAASNSGADQQVADTKQPGKKVLKKSQIKSPPPLHDPN